MSIEQTRSIDNPQKNYEWEIEIVGPSTGGLEGLKAYAQTVNLPEESLEEIVINHKSEKSTHGGRVASARTITVGFFDDELLTVYRYITNWLEIMKNSQTGGGVDRSLYGADLIIRQLNSDSVSVSATHTMKLGFPTSRGEVSLNYDSSEVMTFDATFSFQRHIVE